MSKASNDQWPDMVKVEWDEEGLSVAGTTPTSVVRIGGYDAVGKPMAWIRSAGCAYCNRWAVSFFVGQQTIVDGGLLNAVERRFDLTLIYFCDQHEDAASEELLEKYGAASNRLDLELAEKVEKQR